MPFVKCSSVQCYGKMTRQNAHCQNATAKCHGKVLIGKMLPAKLFSTKRKWKILRGRHNRKLKGSLHCRREWCILSSSGVLHLCCVAWVKRTLKYLVWMTLKEAARIQKRFWRNNIWSKVILPYKSDKDKVIIFLNQIYQFWVITLNSGKPLQLSLTFEREARSLS